MRIVRLLTILALLVTLLGTSFALPRRATAAATWQPAAPMSTARSGHSATLLPDGQLLVVGGIDTPTSVERYDPATNAWSPSAPLTSVRGRNAAALLGDGRLLVIGASSVDSPAAAEVYAPQSDTWIAVPSPPVPSEASLTALADGWALAVAAGQAARFDPATGVWTPTGPLSERAGGYGHTASLLHDGRVLITGGIRGDCGKTSCLNATVARYNPATNSWTTAASMHVPRAQHRALTLTNGQVLVAGSFGIGLDMERYDPASDTWTSSGQLTIQAITNGVTLTSLADGRALLVTQSNPGTTPTSVAQVYTPATNTWQPVAAPTIPRADHTTTLLRDGRVLVAGGSRAGGSAELYGESLPGGQCFAETGQCIAGDFLTTWQTTGGLARHGYPLSDERWELLEDGKPYVVQYFERSRFEHHPENGPPYNILLGHFGRLLYLLDPSRPRSNAVDPLPDATYFAETGHNVSGRFLAYWQAHGDLAQFGLPLSEELRERLEDGNEYTVQYFERARLEYHPENTGTAYEVLLGHFGRRILAARDPNGPTPYPVLPRFAGAYGSNYGLRVRLNAPGGPAASVAGATQEFQHGWMLWRADTRTITVLVSEASGGSVAVGAAWTFSDTWDESQPPGGGPGPGPGLFQPERGFGKVWREHPEISSRLGYALTATERGQTLTTQAFIGGIILDAPEQTNYGPRGLTFVVYTSGRYEVVFYGI